MKSQPSQKVSNIDYDEETERHIEDFYKYFCEYLKKNPTKREEYLS